MGKVTYPNTALTKGTQRRKKGNKGRHHAHAVEDDEPSTKRNRQVNDDSSSDEEYVLISTLMGTTTHGRNDWHIDSGASKHMTGFKESFVKLSEHESPHKVKLGDHYQYLLSPKNGSLPHLPHYMAHLSIFLPYFHQKPCKKPPKGHKTFFSAKNIQNSSKKAKISKKEEKI